VLLSTSVLLQPIPTPQGSQLLLSIIDNQAAKQISFTIDDTTIGRVFATSIPYKGSLFFGAYTQLEFQPCCATFPIQDYRFSGSLYNMQMTTRDGRTEGLTANYMLPFVLDAPPSWDFTYYQSSILGYQQFS